MGQHLRAAWCDGGAVCLSDHGLVDGFLGGEPVAEVGAVGLLGVGRCQAPGQVRVGHFVALGLPLGGVGEGAGHNQRRTGQLSAGVSDGVERVFARVVGAGEADLQYFAGAAKFE